MTDAEGPPSLDGPPASRITATLDATVPAASAHWHRSHGMGYGTSTVRLLQHLLDAKGLSHYGPDPLRA